jgi:uncharacterized protein YlaI
MAPSYNCTGCNRRFDSKSERENHFRGECQTVFSLTDVAGFITRVERKDGKFQCPRCPKAFSYSNNLSSHWKKCKTTEGPESNHYYLNGANYKVQVDNEDPLAKKLRYDGIFNLAVCTDCSYALPSEWIEKHFKDVHNIPVIGSFFSKC